VRDTLFALCISVFSTNTFESISEDFRKVRKELLFLSLERAVRRVRATLSTVGALRVTIFVNKSRALGSFARALCNTNGNISVLLEKLPRVAQGCATPRNTNFKKAATSCQFLQSSVSGCFKQCSEGPGVAWKTPITNFGRNWRHPAGYPSRSM
jgi:hypothetical protein